MAATLNKKFLTTKEVSKILKLKPKDLAHYQKEGLFDYADSKKTKIDKKIFERLKVALTLQKDHGINSAGIDVILSMREKMSRMQKEFNSFLSHVRKRLGTKLDEDLKKITSHR